MNKALWSSKRMDWETPASVFDPLHMRHRFTLDVCARRDNAKVDNFFSISKDGLKQSWRGERCWMNPPYGPHLKLWMAKAVEESKHARIVCLVPARTDTLWFHNYVLPHHKSMRFIKGRIKFVGAKYAAPFPSMIVIFGQ